MDEAQLPPRRREDDLLEPELQRIEPGRRVQLAGLPLEICTLRQAVDGIWSLVGDDDLHLVATVNVDQSLHARDDAEVREAFLSASARYCDGSPLVLLARVLGVRMPARVTGADLLPALCALASRDARRVLFLGGAPGVPEEAARRLTERYPDLQVVGTLSPPLGFEGDPEQDAAVVAAVHRARPDLVFVCLGSPKQELWVHRRRAQLPRAVYLGVGGAIDFAAGRTKRAPLVWRRYGLEWLHRLVHDWRRLWRRYLVNDSRFLLVVALEVWRARGRRRPPRVSASEADYDPYRGEDATDVDAGTRPALQRAS